MTDRIHAIAVILEDALPEDDVQPLVTAIRQMKGVLDVRLDVRDLSTALTTEVRVRTALAQDLYRLADQLRKV
jgi:hypothetical protein